jgi:hypothetical protein
MPWPLRVHPMLDKATWGVAPPGTAYRPGRLRWHGALWGYLAVVPLLAAAWPRMPGSLVGVGTAGRRGHRFGGNLGAVSAPLGVTPSGNGGLGVAGFDSRGEVGVMVVVPVVSRSRCLFSGRGGGFILPPKGALSFWSGAGLSGFPRVPTWLCLVSGVRKVAAVRLGVGE